MSTDLVSKFNLFHYRQSMRKLGPSGREMAKDWCIALIRREHPHFTAEQVERYYDGLIKVSYVVVDEWTQRMS